MRQEVGREGRKKERKRKGKEEVHRGGEKGKEKEKTGFQFPEYFKSFKKFGLKIMLVLPSTLYCRDSDLIMQYNLLEAYPQEPC